MSLGVLPVCVFVYYVFSWYHGYQGTNGCKLSGMGAGTKNQVLFFESKKCS